MARRDGFSVADTSTSLHADPKVQQLWRMLGDETQMNAAMVLYEAVRLASWGAGRRIHVATAAPIWLSDSAAPAASLQRVGLLDNRGRIPVRAWSSWFGEANQRRKKARDRWTRANQKREQRALEPRGSRAVTASTDSVSDSVSDSVTNQAPSERFARAPDRAAPLIDLVEKLSGYRPRGASRQVVVADVKQLGFDAVEEAIRAEKADANGDPVDAAQLVFGAHKRLFPMGGSHEAVDGRSPARRDVERLLEKKRAIRAAGGTASA